MDLRWRNEETELRQLVRDLTPLDPHSDEFPDADADLLELMEHDSSAVLLVLLIELYEARLTELYEACARVPQELMDRAWYFSKDCAYLEGDCKDLINLQKKLEREAAEQGEARSAGLQARLV